MHVEEIRLHSEVLTKMATGTEEISLEGFVDIFGELPDGYEEEFFEANDSDLDEDIFTWDKSESENEEYEDDESDDEDIWSDTLEDFNIEPFDSSNSGIKVEIPDNASALFVFQLMFDEDLMDHVIAETNRLAGQKRADKPQLLEKWHDISRQEFKTYLRLCMMMGICVLPQTAGFWSSDPYLEKRGIISKMTNNRFEEICQYLQFLDSSNEPPKGSPKYDHLYKCRPVLTKVVENVQWAYYPGQNIAIDEAMIAFKGRLEFRQYMPAKPTKYGIKVWMAADSENGYINNIAIYQGSEEGKDGYVHGQGYDAVMSMARPFLNKNHHLFFDNYFSSVRLFDHLLSQETYVCATVRFNCKEMPRCAKQKLKQPGKLICGQKGKLLFTKWHDKRDISFLSTNVSPVIAPQLVERKIKR